MSTVLSTPVSPSNNVPSRARYLPLLKSQPRSYSSWKEPVSDRQLNSIFETHILPDLSRQLEHTFAVLPEYEQEDAVQDATCQALEAYRTLRLYENIRKNTARDETALALAKFASSQYLAGVRFANPRNDSHA